MAEKNGNGEKKARRPSAAKRDGQSLKRNMRNRSYKAEVSTAVRSLQDAITKKDAPSIPAKLNAVYSLMDKGVKKGIYKQNKASRVKARFTASAKQASA